MKLYEFNSYDCRRNLATEEYIFRQFRDGDILLIWQNEPCVIIGKNQMRSTEVNMPLAEQLAIPVVRRNTGGGAVFQDMGNVNFTFIADDSEDEQATQVFYNALLGALKSLGAEAEFNGRNDICVCGRKVSGSAARTEKGRLLHHCTMLVDADIGLMEKLLTPETAKLKRNGVKSVGARVTNLKEVLPNISAELLKQSIAEQLNVCDAFSLPADADEEIERICIEKYENEMWNGRM